MFYQTVGTILLLFCSTALCQNASFTFSEATSTNTQPHNFTSTFINSNATATSIPPVDACVIFVSANGTVPAFTITSQLPSPTSIFSANGTSTNLGGFNGSSSTTEQFNSTVLPGPLPTNGSSFATTFYATVYTSGALPTTSFAVAAPSGLPVCPNVTFSANGTSVNGTNTSVNGTNSTAAGQSLNSSQNANSNKPSSAMSMKKVGRDLAGAMMGAIGGVALAVI